MLSAADQIRGIAQRQLRVVRAALETIAPQRVGVFGVERAARRQRRAPAGLSGNAGEQRAPPHGVGAQAFDAMGPIAFAAQHSQHNDPGLAQGVLDIEIDRGRMPERQQVGQPHGWEAGWQFRISRAERGEFAVGGREHDDVGGPA